MRHTKTTDRELHRVAGEILFNHFLEFRKFSRLRNYGTFDDAATIISVDAAVGLTYSREEMDLIQETDHVAFQAVLVAMRLWKEFDFPVFAIAPELTTALAETLLPNGMPEIDLPVSAGVILLPRKHIFSPDNQEVKEIMFAIEEPGVRTVVAKKVRPGSIYLPSYPERTLHWYVRTKENIIYSSSTSFRRSRCGSFLKLTTEKGNERDTERRYAESKEDQEFIWRLTRIVANFLLYLRQNKLPVDMEEELPAAKGVGFSSKKATKVERRLRPRLIGSSFRMQRISQRHSSSEGGNTRKRPVRHLRIGHYRNLPDGRTTWVSPTYVCDGEGT